MNEQKRNYSLECDVKNALIVASPDPLETTKALLSAFEYNNSPRDSTIASASVKSLSFGNVYKAAREH